MVRQTRDEQVTTNRRKVLEAAGAVFRRKGFHAASVDEISDEAGFSKGVVYSQFGSKDELFLALLEERVERRAGENLNAVRERAGVEGVQALWALAVSASRSDPDWARALLEFRLHASWNPEINRRYAEIHGRTTRGIEGALRAACEGAGIEPPPWLHDLARLTLALDSGRALEEAVAPAGAVDELARDAVVHLFTTSRGHIREGERENR